MEPFQGLRLLADYQSKYPEVENKIHFAFIEGENDSEDDIIEMCDVLRDFELDQIGINIVRYNPYSEVYGQESSEEVIDRNVDLMKTQLVNTNIKIVTRVGFDVKASCGMFVR